MAKILQLVSFYNQRSIIIPGINGKTEQDDIITATDVDTYSIDTDSIFDRVAEDYFGQDYTNTTSEQYYKTNLEVKYVDEPFSIKAGNDYILGEGSWLHAQSYVNNVAWKKNFSVTDFRNCWNVNQNDAVKITADYKPVDCGVSSVSGHDSAAFFTIVDSITFTLDQPALTDYLSSVAFSETTFSANAGDPRLDVTLKPVTWQSVQIGSNTVTFNQVYLRGSISNSYNAPLFVQFRLYADFNLYKIFASVTAKAQLYDHASDAYDYTNIYGSTRYYYLYYGASTATTCLGFTSSRAEHPTQASSSLSSDDLLNSTRCPDDSLDPYKPSSTSTLNGWNLPSSPEWSGTFEQDNYIFINIYKVTPIWFDPDASHLIMDPNWSNKSFSDNTYANNLFLESSSYFSNNINVSRGTLSIPKDSSSHGLLYLSNQTSRLVKVTYSSTDTHLQSIRFNGTRLFDKTPEELSELQNSYLQVNINSSLSPTITLGGGVSLLSACPVAVKFNFKDTTNTIQVYFKLKFSPISSSGAITWTLDADYNIPLILKSTTPSVSIGESKTLLGGSYYYSFGNNTYFAPSSRQLAFNAIFDETKDNVLFVDQYPTNSPTYKLDDWNKAYPTKYFFKYKSNSYAEKTLRVGIIDNLFVPTFNWTTLSLARFQFEGVNFSAANYTTYRLHLVTSISNSNQISYKLVVAYKTGSTSGYSKDYTYNILSPLLLVKLTSGGGAGGAANTSAYKGGGGGGSGAGAYVILDLSYTSALKGCYIYICLGRNIGAADSVLGASSYISFEEPSYVAGVSDVMQIRSSDFVKLTVGENGHNWTSDSDYNKGGSGGTANTDSSVDSYLCSYCHVLSLINGESGGRGESNSGESGQYDSSAEAGDSIYKYVHCIKNRRILSYSSSNSTQLINYSGADPSVYDPNDPAYTFSPGGGGAASIFASALRNTNQSSPSISSIPVGTGGGGGYAFHPGSAEYRGPEYGGAAFAEIYYLPVSS